MKLKKWKKRRHGTPATIVNVSRSLEKSIHENEALVLTYSGILQAKQEVLRAKEELVYHFYDLLVHCDEKIKIREEQCAMITPTKEGTTPLTSNIIDNYE